MALTKKDIEKLSEIFATKKDFERLLNDFGGLRNDFGRLPEVFATKEDLKRFATKEEMNARFDRVNTTLDWLVGAFRDFKDELTVRYGQVRQHNDQLENHEIRIKKIEEKVLV